MEPHRALREQGFFVVRGAHGEAALREIRDLLDRALAELPLPDADAWGIELQPLIERVPRMAPHLEPPRLAAALEDALGGPFRRLLDGARFTSRGPGGFLPWHFHAPPAAGQRGDGRWDPGRPGAPEAVRRVIATAYPDGATAESGPLYVYPRREGDPWRPPHADPAADWPGAVTLHLDPGDVAVWDEATYHAARCLRGPRRIFGGVYESARDPGS